MILIVGKRPGSSSTDVVAIFPKNTRFDFSNPLLALPIPSTGNAAQPETKLINLRRVTRKVIIDGFIIDTRGVNASAAKQLCNNGLYSDGSARGVGFDSNGNINYNASGCVAVRSSLEKKWILEEFALAGAESDGGLSLIWRGISNPNGTNENRNVFYKRVFISELTIEDNAMEKQVDQNSPEMFQVKVTLIRGEPTG